MPTAASKAIINQNPMPCSQPHQRWLMLRPSTIDCARSYRSQVVITTAQKTITAEIPLHTIRKIKQGTNSRAANSGTPSQEARAPLLGSLQQLSFSQYTRFDCAQEG